MKTISSRLFSPGKEQGGMAKISREELLKDQRVIEEIKRHLWIESEKAGHDIGFDKAAEDWLARFSAGWVKHYMPDKTKKSNPLKKGKAF